MHLQWFGGMNTAQMRTCQRIQCIDQIRFIAPENASTLTTYETIEHQVEIHVSSHLDFQFIPLQRLIKQHTVYTRNQS